MFLQELKEQYTTLCKGTGLTTEDSIDRIICEVTGVLTNSDNYSNLGRKLLLKRHLDLHQQTGTEKYDLFRRSSRTDEDELWGSSKGFWLETMYEREEFDEDEGMIENRTEGMICLQ
jgi:hypothetical protein